MYTTYVHDISTITTVFQPFAHPKWDLLGIQSGRVSSLAVVGEGVSGKHPSELSDPPHHVIFVVLPTLLLSVAAFHADQPESHNWQLWLSKYFEMSYDPQELQFYAILAFTSTANSDRKRMIFARANTCP